MALEGRTQLGSYRIDARIGAGGMGQVYRARDLRLERPVAIKILTHAPDAEQARTRLLAEARAASALNHPHICTIYEVGEIDEQPFIAMELVEGRSLTDTIPREGLSTDAVARYGVHIAEGLHHAHDRGIVHRDLKSANVIVTSDGRAKILDFGLATGIWAPPDAATRSGAPFARGEIAGTLPYMPPEVLQGGHAGPSSDIWSLGVLLYEMASGMLPFRGGTPLATSDSILNGEPAPLPGRVPPSLRRVIARCLRKQPGERYQRAGEIAAALQAIRDGVDHGRADSQTDPVAKSIAVLPFHDLAQNPADASLGLGLADATITELAMVKELLVRPTAAILRFQGTQVDPVQAGLELGVDSVVHGTFQRLGGRVRVTVQLVATDSGRSLWGTKVSTSLDDVFDLQDEVSRQVADALQVELTQSDERRLARSHVSGKAYALFAEGRLHAFQESIEHVSTAVGLFERAIEADPGFARAYASLADAYLRIDHTWDPDGDWFARGEKACEQALALDPGLAEGHHLRGRLAWSAQRRFDHATAIRAFMAAVAGRPNLNESHHWLGIVLFHVGMFNESLDCFSRARAISPDDMVALMHEGYCQYLRGDYQRALELSTEAITWAPSLWARYQLALAELQTGALDAAERTVNLAARTYPGDVLCYPVRGLIAARRGQADEADRQIALTIRNQKAFGHYHHAQYDVACIHALLGRKDRALEWLHDGAHNGFPCAAFFEHDPLLASIRNEPAFDALMRDLRAECDGYARLYRTLQGSQRG
jgi:serine/threonine protein kinase/Tfp pilus assembly protein PilF